MDDLPHLEAAARISVVTVIASVNELTTGIDLIKEEIDTMKNIQIKHQNDCFVKIMEVCFLSFFLLHLPFLFFCYISLFFFFATSPFSFFLKKISSDFFI
jgi:hypothetical protein